MTPEHQALAAKLRGKVGRLTEDDCTAAASAIESLSAQCAQPQASEPVAAWKDATGTELHKLILNYQKEDMIASGGRQAERAANYSTPLYAALVAAPTPVPDAVENAFRAGFVSGEAAGKFDDDHENDAWSRYSATLASNKPVGDGIAAIAAERRRQIEAEGWSAERDDSYHNGELARAGGIYAVIAGSDETTFRNAEDGYSLNDVIQSLVDRCWPWDKSWLKITTRRRALEKAGACIAAEIDRLDRLSLQPAARRVCDGAN